MIAVSWRRAGSEDGALEGLVREALAGVLGSAPRLLAYGRSAWESAEARGLDAAALAGLGSWHAALAERNGEALIEEARILEGPWNAGAISLRSGRTLHVYCGWIDEPWRVLKHELLHYYLRKLMPASLVGGVWEERLVQYETGWYGDDLELERCLPRLQEASRRLNLTPFDRGAFARALEGWR